MDGAYSDVLSQWYARPGHVDIERGLPYGSTILNADGTAPATSPATRYPSHPHRHRLTKSAPYPGHEDEYLSRLRVTRSDPADVEDCLHPKNCPYHPNVTRTPLYNINYNGTVRPDEAIPTYHDEEVVKPKNFARWMMPIFGHPPRNPSIVSSVNESEKGKRGPSRGTYYICRRCIMFDCVCWGMFIIIVLFVPIYLLYMMKASPQQLYPINPPENQVIPGTPPSTIFPWYREFPAGSVDDSAPAPAPKPSDDSGLHSRHISDKVEMSSEAPLILSRIARFGRRPPHHGRIKEIQEVDKPKSGEQEKAERSSLIHPIGEPIPVLSIVSEEVPSIAEQSTRRQFIPSGVQRKADEAWEFLQNIGQTVKRFMVPHHWFRSKAEESSNNRQSIPSEVQQKAGEARGVLENMSLESKEFVEPHHWFGLKAEESSKNRQPILSEVQKRENEAGEFFENMSLKVKEFMDPKSGSSVQKRVNKVLEFLKNTGQEVKEFMDPHHWFGTKLEESSTSRHPSDVQKRVNEVLDFPEITSESVKEFMDPHHWLGAKSEESVEKLQDYNLGSGLSTTSPHTRGITITEKPTRLRQRKYHPPPPTPEKCHDSKGDEERCPSLFQTAADLWNLLPKEAKIAVPVVFGWLVIPI